MQHDAPGVRPDQAHGGPDPNAKAQSEAAVPDTVQVAALEDRLRRALADLDNLRKRYARELDRERVAASDRVAAAWLPVLDNLDLDDLSTACAEETRWEFLFTVAPLVLRRGTASPVNPIALF